MNTEQVIEAAKKIKERVEAASIWDDGEDSPMRCINAIDEQVVIILHELNVPQEEWGV